MSIGFDARVKWKKSICRTRWIIERIQYHVQKELYYLITVEDTRSATSFENTKNIESKENVRNHTKLLKFLYLFIAAKVETFFSVVRRCFMLNWAKTPRHRLWKIQETLRKRSIFQKHTTLTTSLTQYIVARCWAIFCLFIFNFLRRSWKQPLIL